MTQPVGAILQGRYELLRPLGQGGMASTFLAADRLLRRELALKLLELPGPEGLELLRAEFSVLSGLDHPHLARVHDFGTEPAGPGAPSHFYTADYVAGVTLDRFAVARGWEEVSRALCDALQGLAFLHGLDIRHGDFKPQNVLVRPDGHGTLIDLGCAGRCGVAPPVVSGTPEYLAPELLEGGVADGRSDLYSVGVTLEELLRRTGHLASAELRTLIERLTSRTKSQRPAEVPEVLELLGDSRPVLAAPGGKAGRLLGRGGSLRRFDQAFAAWRGGRPGPRLLLLQGPPGIGKSRLLTQMKWRAQLTATVFEGSVAAERPIDSMLALALGRNDLPSGVAGVVAAHEELNARQRSVALCLDDVDELGDDQQRQAFESLVRCLARDDRLLLLATTAHDWTDRGPALERIELGPLGRDAVADWIEPHGLADELGQVLERTHGVPARIEALLASHPHGLLVDGDGPITAASDETRAAKGSLARVVGGLDQLGTGAQQLLALLAAVGGSLEAELVGRAADDVAVAQLSASAWIRRQQTTWRLAGIVECEELLAAFEPSARLRAHEQAAQLFLDAEQRRAATAVTVDGGELLARAAYQLVAANDLSGAERLLLERPVDGAASARRWAAAAERIARQSDRVPVLLGAARVLLEASRPRAALGALAQILRRDRSMRHRWTWCMLAGRCYHSLGRSRRARPYLERAMDDPTVATAERAATAALLARVHVQRGAYDEARTVATAALAGCPPRERPSLCLSLGIAASYAGRDDETRKHLAEAAELSERAGDGEGRMRAQSYLAIHESRQGNLDAAIAGYRAAVEVAERHHLVPLLSSALLNLGTACQRRGDWGGALEHYRRGLRLARALGRASTEATLQINLANLHTEIGSFDRGLSGLEQVTSAARVAGLTHVAGMLCIIRGEVALARGDLDEAEQQFERARSFHGERADEREQAEAELHLAEVAVARGDVDRAARQIGAAARRADSLGAQDLSVQVKLLEGMAAAAERPVAAERLLDEARQQCDRTGQRLLAARVHRELATLLASAGRPAEAQQHRQEARAIWAGVADSLPPQLRDSFWSHPKRAGLLEAGPASSSTALAATVHATAEGVALQRFLEINRRINSSLAVEQVLEFAMDAAIELSGAERGFVLLAGAAGAAGLGAAGRSDQAGEPWQVAIARNLDRQAVGEEHFAFSTSIAARVLEQGEPVITVDAARDERFVGHRSVHAMQLKSVVVVPIRSPDGVLGALYLDNRFQRGRFGPPDLTLLQAFADQVAIALGNAQRHGELRGRAERLEADNRAKQRLTRGQAREIERLNREVDARQQALEHRYDYRQIVGRSAPMRAVLSTLDRVIETPLPVLVQGESGTGKELIARAIHFNSRRRQHPFVTINCAAMPEALLESELFGHVRGAFTGATEAKEGLMVYARGGTLLLDEIGEMPASMQVKLLRVLQEREVRPVGGVEVLPVDLRVLAATNKDLAAEVQRGAFREDLFYRLAVVVVELPPLRERPEDIFGIAQSILRRLARDEERDLPELTRGALRSLLSYRWPGNVRQLENVIAKAYYLSDRDRIGPDEIELPRRRRAPVRARARQQFEEQQIARILDALHETRWNVSAVSRMLGIPRNTLYRKLRTHGIVRPSPR